MREEIANQKQSKITQIVKKMYEKYSFPSWNYEEAIKVSKQLKNNFKECGIDINKKLKLIDIGCGTGLHSKALSMLRFEVTGIDISENSINIAKEKCGNHQIKFICNDLFSYQPKQKFDIVFCMGVLHHTKDAKASFEKIVSFLSHQGYIIVGLYNKIGINFRFLNWFLRKCFNTTKERLNFVKKNKKLFLFLLSPLSFKKILNSSFITDENIVDTFCHVHRSYHSINEVKKWFNENNINYLGYFGKSSWFNKLTFFTLIGRKNSNLH